MSISLSSTPDATTPSASSADLQQLTLDNLPLMVSLYKIESRSKFRHVLANRPVFGPEGTPEDAIVGKYVEELVPLATAQQLMHQFHICMDTGNAVVVEDSYQLDTGLMWTYSRFAPIHQPDGTISHILVTWEDITERKKLEQEEQQRKEELIEHQAAQLAELSTPMLSISETTVVMPIVGAIDTRRVQMIMQTLLNGVAETRATVVIMDITGVPVVDTQVANALIRTSQAVALLGAKVVLTGIRPEVAQTLVGLGVDLSNITTRGTLRDGIAFALARI